MKTENLLLPGKGVKKKVQTAENSTERQGFNYALNAVGSVQFEKLHCYLDE